MKYKFFLSILLTVFFLIPHSTVFCSEKSDSLINVLKKTHDADAVPLLNQIANELKKESPDDAINYAKKALKISSQRDDVYGKSEAYYNLGRSYYYARDLDNSLLSYEQALTLKKQLNEQPAEAGLLYNIGMIYHMRGELEKALEYYQQSYDIEEKVENKQNVARCINVIGIIYMDLKNYDVAIEKFKKSLIINNELGNKAGEADAYLNIGTIFQKNKNIDSTGIDSAVAYYQKALVLYQEINFVPKIGLAINNIGVIYKNQEKYQEAIKYYKKAEEIYEQNNDLKGLSQTLGNIGTMMYEGMKKYNESLPYIQKSLDIAKEQKFNDIIIDNYRALSAIYKGLGNYKVSLEYYVDFFELKDSLFTEKVHQQIAEMNTKYETDKKEQQIELLNKDQVIKDKEIKQQQILLYIFIIVSVVILIFLILLIRLFSQKKKANIKLELQNEEILQQKEEIQAQAEQLRFINSELEKLSIVASETDNSVIIADAEGNFEWVNEGFTRLMGYTFEEFIEEKGKNIFDNSSNTQLSDIINESIQNKTSAVYSSQTKTKSGEQIWLQTTLTPIIDSVGNLTKLVAIDSDITKVKLAEAEIMRQRDLIHEQKQELTDSIHYAERIQKAVLPDSDFFQKNLPDHFVLFKPHSVVSGDFYWATSNENKVIVTAADCTGHGVPGAFMSMLGISFLNEIVNNAEIQTAGEILDKLRENVITALHQKGVEGEQKDGMDMALCMIDMNTKEIQFAGANNPLYMLKKSSGEVAEDDCKTVVSEDGKYELVEIKPDKMPIAIYVNMQNFTTHRIQMEEGDSLYLFSDGYADQFGGPKGKKFKYKPFKQLLVDNYQTPMSEQREILENAIVEWMSYTDDITGHPFEQIDDIVVIGLKF